MATDRATRRGMTKRAFLAGGTASLSAGMAVACASPGGAPTTPAADLKGVSIEYWTWSAATHPEGIGTKKVMEHFGANNPHGVTVSVASPSTGGQATFEKTVAAVAAGTPPDIMHGQHFYLSDLFRQGATVEVEEALKGNADWRKARASLYPHILGAGFTWKGKVFGVPWDSSHFTLYYQPEFLKRANLASPPPKSWSWDQFLDYSRKASNPPDVTGYDCNFFYARTGMMLLNNGHKFMSADGTKFSCNSPEAVEAIEFQLQMVRQGLMRPHDGSASASGGYSEKLPEGKVVFQLAVAARVPTYRQQGAQFGTCYYPIGPKNRDKTNFTHGEAYGEAVFKNKDARKQQAALLAALWGTRPDMGLLLAQEAGTPPSYRATVESPDFQAQFKKDGDSWPFYDILPGFIPMPNFPGFGAVRTLGDQMIPQIWSGKGTTREILDEYTRLAQIKLDEVLR